MSAWAAEPLEGFPDSIKHGQVIPITQDQYDTIVARYTFV